MTDTALPESPIEAGWRELSQLDQRVASGLLDEAGWHRELTALITRAYLHPDDPDSTHGYLRERPRWEQARRPIMEAVERDGTFLDVGCGSGMLMQLIQQWSVGRALLVEPYGVEISPALADLARHRVPEWAERIHTANIRHFSPPFLFDYVRANLEILPESLWQQLVDHLLEMVKPGGRLILGVYAEPVRARPTREHALRSWGHKVAGHADQPNRTSVVHRAVWIDKPS